MNLKKINRGIVLGCAVVVATAVYIVADRQQFKKNTDAVSNAVESYLNDMADVRCSTQNQNQLRTNYRNVINNHWTDIDWNNVNAFDYIALKNELISELDADISTYHTQGYFTKYEIKIDDISVSKYGNGACANVKYKVADEFFGAPLDLTSWGFEATDNEDVDTVTGENVTDPSIQYRQTWQIDCNFYLEKVDGEWKIYGSSYNENNYNTQNISNDSSSTADSEQKGGADSE